MVLFRQHSDFQENKLETTAQEKENHLGPLIRVWFDKTVSKRRLNKEAYAGWGQRGAREVEGKRIQHELMKL